MNKDNVRILQLCASQFTYEKFVAPLSFELASQGCFVSAAFWVENSNVFNSELSNQDIEIIDLKLSRSKKITNIIKNIIILFNFFRSNKDKFDIVHMHTPIVSFCARIALLGISVKKVYTVHGYFFHELMPNPSRSIHQLIEFVLAKATDLILFVSKEDYEFAMKRKFKNSTYLKFVGNGCDIKRFNSYDVKKSAMIKSKFNITENDFVIGYSGRFVKEKGIIHLLESFSLLSHKYSNMKLVLCGGFLVNEYGLDIKTHLQQAINSNIGKIICTGFVSDIENYYNIMDLFVLPSYREGLPTSLIEAMSSGTLCIATKIRGCREVITDGEDGYLVNSHSTEELSSKIEMIYKNKRKLICISNNAKINASSKYDIKHVLKCTTEEILNIL